jgi:hypothetical protein
VSGGLRLLDHGTTGLAAGTEHEHSHGVSSLINGAASRAVHPLG